ncbi:MAG: ABC transporter permease [Acidimicrobiia bacterium]|nr:ABC transporter permease [Acidimicrobiia bacterium]
MIGARASAVARKEFRQIARDGRTLFILLFIPVFFLLLFGYALSWDIRGVRLAVDDRDRTVDSRALVSAFVQSEYFTLANTIQSDEHLTRLMDTNAIRAALVIPSGYARDLTRGERVPVQVLLNGDNANTATTVMGYVNAVIEAESARRLSVASGGATVPVPILVEPRIWYNPQLRSALFLVPGLIAYIAMITAVISTSLSIVREKERGTIEQVRMAPLNAVSFIIGKTLPYLLISLVAELAIVGAAMWLFDLPMRGSWGVLLLALTLYLVGALGLGLLISSIADSQQVAFQVAMLASLLPTLLLSGFIFPIASMPQPLQTVTRIVPARYFLVALRGVMLKGSSLATIQDQLIALTVYAAAMIGLASIRLRRQWH